MTTNAYSPLWFQLFMPLQTEEQTAKDVAFLARQLPLPRYRRVLDLCCGFGRHAVALVARGYDVTGVDRDPAAIEEARRRAATAGLPVNYVVADMRATGTLPGLYDAVINMWQSFSYFDEQTNHDLLRQLHHLLASDGRFIIDLYHRGYFERQTGRSRREIDGVTVETNGYMSGNRWHSELRYSNASGDLGADHLDWQMFTPDEFAQFAAGCGFRLLLACAWADEHIAPAPDIARMQLVLQKA